MALAVATLTALLCFTAVAVFGASALRAEQAALPRSVRPFPNQLSGTIVFESDIAGRQGLYTLRLQTGRIARLTGDAGVTERSPRWSPDGRRVAFSSNRGSDGRPSTDFDIWVVDADGSNAVALTDTSANESDPTWTPDGDAIVYSSDEASRGDLYRLSVEGEQRVRLTRHFVGRAIMPTVSRQPSRVAFAAQTLRVGAFWDYQVHVRRPDGSVSALPASTGACWPRWSPDGSALAHVRLESDAPSAIEVRRGPSLASSTVLRADGLWAYYPAWSPDASRLAFSVSPEHHDGENWDLAVVDIATSRWMRLTEGPGNDRLPDWKP